MRTNTKTEANAKAKVNAIAKTNRINSAIISLSLVLAGIFLFACNKGEEPYLLQKEDIKIEVPTEGFKTKVNQLLKINVNSVSDENIIYQWLLDGEEIAQTKNLEYMFEQAGVYNLMLIVKQNEVEYKYDFNVNVIFDEQPAIPEGATAYITKVFDYMPAVGQFVNKLPKYEEGDTQEAMNKKVLDCIGNNNKIMITLGGFGGYVVVGFDHTIQNIKGKRDFRVLGNAFYANANPNPDAPKGGSCEPGIIMVAYDANNNGVPDDNEWYEIAGSAHEDPTKELWYSMAEKNGNDINRYLNYTITYFSPEKEPSSKEEWSTYIKWEDNKGNSGYKVKNQFHKQSYFPLWAKEQKLSFTGTCLPQNGIDESGAGNYYVLYKFNYGYADNEINTQDDSAIDIDWAINSKGQKVSLPGVDFIKIYTGVNQENGWLGECSTEVLGIDDLHVLGVDIDTRK